MAKTRGTSKLAKKSKRTTIKSATSKRIRKLVQIDSLDQILLNMAAKPYDKILKQIRSGKKRLNEERRIALQVGTRILNKAKKVRDSLMSSSKNS